MKRVPLILLALAFAWTAFQAAGVELAGWNVTLLALAALAALLFGRSGAPPLERRLAWPLALLPAWVLVQIVPLPPAVVRLLSPARAELASALSESRWIPLSAFPAMTVTEWTHLAGSILVFLSVRELAWRYSGNRTPWIVALPLVAVAVLEAALGLVQFYTGVAAGEGAHGTYVSRDHFAALLEMALPFPVMYGFTALWRGGSRRFHSPLRPALLASASFAVASLLLLGAIHSLSRMGFIASLFALAVLGAAAVPKKRWLLLLPAAGLALFLYLPPNELIVRFADLSTVDKITSQDRVEVWRETLPLIRAYALVGCGLGAYESVFMRFKHQAPTIVDNYAHNDYLQYLAELGVFGFLVGTLLVGGVLRSAARAASRHASPAGRALALASLASMAALLLHSTVDFNSYIPGNALAFAWAGGLAVSAMFSSRPITPAAELVLEVKTIV